MAQPVPMPEPILPDALWYFDGALATVGVLFLGAWIRCRGRGGWLTDCPDRPNALRIEHIVIPMLAFLVAGILSSAALTPFDGNRLPAGTADLLAGSSAQLCGGLACVLLAGVTFTGKARAFLRGDRTVGRQVLLGAVGLVAVFPLCWLLSEAAVRLFQALAPEWALPQHDVLQILDQPDLPGWVPVVLWIGAVAVAPFAEEAFFRGICQTALRDAFGRPGPAIWVVSVLFGISHYNQPQVVAPLVALGVALGLVYERSGSLIGPMTLHLLFNLKTLVYVTVARAQT